MLQGFEMERGGVLPMRSRVLETPKRDPQDDKPPKAHVLKGLSEHLHIISLGWRWGMGAGRWSFRDGSLWEPRCELLEEGTACCIKEG